MRVVCVNNKDIERNFTVGKTYDVLKEFYDDDGFYSLRNDRGYKSSVGKGFFEVVLEDNPTGIPTFDGDINSQVGGDHYSKNDPIQFAKDNYPPEHLEGFFRINVDKYMARYDKKNGIEDIKKAKHYIEMLLELREQQDAE